MRAYKGSLESSDSNTLCLGSTSPGTTTKTFAPSNPVPRVVWNYYSNCNLHPTYSQKTGEPPFVGFWFDEGVGDPFLCAGHTNLVLRSLTRFDLGDMRLMPSVWSATLTYHLYTGDPFNETRYGDNEDGRDPNRLQIPAHTDATRSCAVDLMLPTQDWTNSNSSDLVPADDYIQLPERSASGSFSVDVTGAVRRWQEYGTNYGVEFAGAREDTGAEENSECTSTIFIDSLQVTWFQ